MNGSAGVLIFIKSSLEPASKTGGRKPEPSQDHDAATQGRGTRKQGMAKPFTQRQVRPEDQGAKSKHAAGHEQHSAAAVQRHGDKHRRMREEYHRHGREIPAVTMGSTGCSGYASCTNKTGQDQQQSGQQCHDRPFTERARLSRRNGLDYSMGRE